MRQSITMMLTGREFFDHDTVEHLTHRQYSKERADNRPTSQFYLFRSNPSVKLNGVKFTCDFAVWHLGVT
jgi:hypothetical protein